MYIRATAGISPQPSFERLLTDPVAYPGNRLRCVEPDYTARIDAKMIRRMSRIIKMGVAAALDCLEIAGIEMPGATRLSEVSDFGLLCSSGAMSRIISY